MALTNSPPIDLLAIQTEAGASSLLGSQTVLNVPITHGSYVSMLDFLGASNYVPTFQSINFTSSQDYTIPSTSNGSLNVYVVGGGGGGGNSAYANGYPYGDGGDGGAGGLASNTVSVTPGSTYYIEVGGGGAKGHWVYGYKDNPHADGYGGGGGGESSAFGVVAGGGGGGGGGDPGASGGGGGGPYGGGGGRGNTYKYDPYGNIVDGSGDGGSGGGTGNNLGWNGNGYGGGGHTNGAKTGGPQYGDSSAGTQGLVLIQGYW
jgi:hypothetical protein